MELLSFHNYDWLMMKKTIGVMNGVWLANKFIACLWIISNTLGLSIQFNSIQFKALFRVDINHTYNTSSNELLKSTMVNILNKNIHQFMQ